MRHVEHHIAHADMEEDRRLSSLLPFSDLSNIVSQILFETAQIVQSSEGNLFSSSAAYSIIVDKARATPTGMILHGPSRETEHAISNGRGQRKQI